MSIMVELEIRIQLERWSWDGGEKAARDQRQGVQKRTPTPHWESFISIYFHKEWGMIAVTVFEPNGNSIWFKNRHRDHIPFTVKGNGNIVFSVPAWKFPYRCVPVNPVIQFYTFTMWMEGAAIGWIEL